MTNRILPETLPALYRKHGVVPMQNVYLRRVIAPTEMCYACGATMAYLGITGNEPPPYPDDDIVVRLGLSPYYEFGYLEGFDGKQRRAFSYPVEDSQRTDYDLGYADGAAGWAAVKDLAVAE